MSIQDVIEQLRGAVKVQKEYREQLQKRSSGRALNRVMYERSMAESQGREYAYERVIKILQQLEADLERKYQR